MNGPGRQGGQARGQHAAPDEHPPPTHIHVGMCVKVVDQSTVRQYMGESHWSSVYHTFCDGRQSGVVHRIVGRGLAFVKFQHVDGTSSSLTFPFGALIPTEPLPLRPSPFSKEPRRGYVPPVAVGRGTVITHGSPSFSTLQGMMGSSPPPPPPPP
eukprot:Sspe_Gene.15610::Locus_5436_Transcript_1_1_Confidence_1.000_Length_531::g.15610::m.15610